VNHDAAQVTFRSCALRAILCSLCRCRHKLHKIRNVADKLPDHLASTVTKRMRAAYHAESALTAQAHTEGGKASNDLDTNRSDRVGGGVAPPPLTPPDMRARIRRFVKPFGRDAARFG
jgi:hypothetical protein